MKINVLTLTASVLAIAASPLLAGPTAMAVTDLNMRSGPGPHHPVIGVIEKDAQTEVVGCIKDSQWCKVSYEGADGWAYGEYLVDPGKTVWVPVISPDNSLEYESVTYEDETNTGAVVGGSLMGAIAGGLIGGPGGAVAGAVAGGALGTAAEPEPREEEVTFVRANMPEPIYLEGEVVPGALLPDVVELQPIPESKYEFAHVNGLPVLVNPESRIVIHILR